jgi:hypothetical protein
LTFGNEGAGGGAFEARVVGDAGAFEARDDGGETGGAVAGNR